MKQNMRTKEVIMVGMFTAIVSVLSIIEIPMPSGVPITLQTFAVALCGCVLGAKMGAMSSLIYMLIGIIGIPVFSGMSAGIRVVVGPTGGFLYGFIIMAFLCGFGNKYRSYVIQGAYAIVGLLICHLLGAFHFSLVMQTSLWQSILLVSIPYLIKDGMSLIVALVLGKAVRRALAAAHLMEVPYAS